MKDFEQFGKEIWKIIKDEDYEFDEFEEFFRLAEKAGICKYVEYNPEAHGDEPGEYAEPGDMIYVEQPDNQLNLPINNIL
jgi:hypothetical protein